MRIIMKLLFHKPYQVLCKSLCIVVVKSDAYCTWSPEGYASTQEIILLFTREETLRTKVIHMFFQIKKEI